MNQKDRELDLTKEEFAFCKLQRDELQLMANHFHKLGYINNPSITELATLSILEWLKWFEGKQVNALPFVELEAETHAISGDAQPVDEDDLHDKTILLDSDMVRRLQDCLYAKKGTWVTHDEETHVMHSVHNYRKFLDRLVVTAKVIAAICTIVYEEGITVGLITSNFLIPVFDMKAHGKNMHRGAILNRSRVLFLDRESETPLMYVTQPRLYRIGDNNVGVSFLDPWGKGLKFAIDYIQDNREQLIANYQDMYSDPQYNEDYGRDQDDGIQMQ